MSTTETSWLALLRAVNVGKHHRIPMAEMRELMADAGFADAATHLQSGNVLFRSSDNATNLGNRITTAIADRYGYDITVIMRNAVDLRFIVENVPFEYPANSSSGVVFMNGTPDATPDASAHHPDELVVVGPDIYVDIPTGFGKTKLTVDWIERQTGLRGTRRNWKTVKALRDKLSDLSA